MLAPHYDTMTTPSMAGYFKTFSDELMSQSDRIRQLIGSKHWLTDGHHKEYLLEALLTRHLPQGLLACRGFVINPQNPNMCSREQDLLIIDVSHEAPLFHQSGVAVAFPRQVVATISVKTTLNTKAINDSIDCLATVGDINNRNGVNTTWFGAYFFAQSDVVADEPSRAYEYVRRALGRAKKKHSNGALTGIPPAIDFICCGGNLAFKRRTVKPEESAVDQHKLLGRIGNGLATALFMADLMDHIASLRNSGPLVGIAASLDQFDTSAIGSGQVELLAANSKSTKRKKKAKSQTHASQ